MHVYILGWNGVHDLKATVHVIGANIILQFIITNCVGAHSHTLALV